MIPEKLRQEIERWIAEKRYGNLQINFSGGKIVNVNKNESLKVELLGGNGSATFSPTGTTNVDS